MNVDVQSSDGISRAIVPELFYQKRTNTKSSLLVING